jgi:hypothetical protein
MTSRPGANTSTEKWIALLGRRDLPTDGVEDYCKFLGHALARRGVEFKKIRLNWMDEGWTSALWKLRRESTEWSGAWVLLQYTALGWSRRGFPFGALLAVAILNQSGKRCAVVFHEPFALDGSRWIDKFRGACQNWIVRELHRRSEKSIMTAPLETIGWLPRDDRKAAFVPIGANIPEGLPWNDPGSARNGRRMTVAVYCVDPPPYRKQELDDIAHAVLSAAKNGIALRIVFLGKGTIEARGEIERKFRETGVEVSILGILDPEQISHSLMESDALLSVRGTVYPRRGSAIAGVACGIPVVGYTDGGNIYPLSEAGLQVAPRGDQTALADALMAVLQNCELREELRARSRHAFETFFSWEVIARKLHQALAEPGTKE